MKVAILIIISVVLIIIVLGIWAMFRVSSEQSRMEEEQHNDTTDD